MRQGWWLYPVTLLLVSPLAVAQYYPKAGSDGLTPRRHSGEGVSRSKRTPLKSSAVAKVQWPGRYGNAKWLGMGTPTFDCYDYQGTGTEDWDCGNGYVFHMVGTPTVRKTPFFPEGWSGRQINAVVFRGGTDHARMDEDINLNTSGFRFCIQFSIDDIAHRTAGCNASPIFALDAGATGQVAYSRTGGATVVDVGIGTSLVTYAGNHVPSGVYGLEKGWNTMCWVGTPGTTVGAMGSFISTMNGGESVGREIYNVSSSGIGAFSNTVGGLQYLARYYSGGLTCYGKVSIARVTYWDSNIDQSMIDLVDSIQFERSDGGVNTGYTSYFPLFPKWALLRTELDQQGVEIATNVVKYQPALTPPGAVRVGWVKSEDPADVYYIPAYAFVPAHKDGLSYQTGSHGISAGNWVFYSGQLDNAAWSKLASAGKSTVVTADQLAAPDNHPMTPAELVEFSAVANNGEYSYLASNTMTQRVTSETAACCFFARAGTLSSLKWSIAEGATPYTQRYDGTAALTSTWKRYCATSATITGTTFNLLLGARYDTAASATQTQSAGTAYIWGAQCWISSKYEGLEYPDYVESAGTTITQSQGALAMVVTDGLQDVNRLWAPNEIGNTTYWANTNVTINQNVSNPLAPDGTATADSVVDTQGTNGSWISRDIRGQNGFFHNAGTNSATEHVFFSVYLRAGTSTKAYLGMGTHSGSGCAKLRPYLDTDLTLLDLKVLEGTCTVSALSGAYSMCGGSVSNLGSSWCRVGIVYKNTTFGGLSIEIGPYHPDDNTTWGVNKSIVVWGAFRSSAGWPTKRPDHYYTSITGWTFYTPPFEQSWSATFTYKRDSFMPVYSNNSIMSDDIGNSQRNRQQGLLLNGISANGSRIISFFGRREDTTVWWSASYNFLPTFPATLKMSRPFPPRGQIAPNDYDKSVLSCGEVYNDGMDGSVATNPDYRWARTVPLDVNESLGNGRPCNDMATTTVPYQSPIMVLIQGGATGYQQKVTELVVCDSADARTCF